MSDGILFSYESGNPGRTLRPIIRSLSAGESVRRQPPDARLVVSLTMQVADAARLVHDCLMEVGGLPEAPDVVYSALLAAARAMARARRVLADIRPRAVVVASQHSTIARSFLWAARTLSVPTVYIPHAPLAANRQYLDVPTDFVGLRGVEEARAYVARGLKREPDVVGNPAIDAPLSRSFDENGPVIVALPPSMGVETVDSLNRVHEHLGRAVVVAPHPALDEAALRNLHGTFVVARVPTVELLRTGAACLIQTNSGVGLEALACGVPVVDLAPPTEGRAYEYMRTPFVTSAAATASLAQAVARSIAYARGNQDALVRWATGWCDAVGEASTTRSTQLIRDAVLAGPQPTMLLDGWRDVPWTTSVGVEPDVSSGS